MPRLDKHPETMAEAIANVAHQQERDAFVAWCREGLTPTLLQHVASLLEDRRDPYYYGAVQQRIDAFAKAHGWADTIQAIGQAHRERERARRELMDRR